MIRQRELWSAVEDQKALAILEKGPEVQAYLLAKRVLAEKESSLQKRVKLGEEVQPGKIRIEVKRVYAVAHQKMLDWLKLRTWFIAALKDDADAQEKLRLAAEKSPESDFVSERLTIELVES